MPKRNTMQHPGKRAFIAAYRQSGNIRASCEAAGIDRVTYWRWTESDMNFTIAARQAKEEYGDLLEAKLAQMALREGNLQAVITALKMAGRYRETTRTEVTGADGNPIEVNATTGTLSDRVAGIAARFGAEGVLRQPVEG